MKGRFSIGRHIDKGSNGSIYKVTDLQNPKIPLVIKITDDCMPFTSEINAMRKIRPSATIRPDDSTPSVIDYGLINHELDGEVTMLAYLIMPRYSHNLDTWFEKMKFTFTNETILHLAQRLLSVFEEIHSAGYVFNDLKLDNIMVGYGQKLLKVNGDERKNSLEGVSVHLVDFGYASKFMKKACILLKQM